MIVYQVINYLISQPKHMLWVLKRTATMRRFFKAPNYRLNLMGKKIFTTFNQKCVNLDSDVHSM